MKLTTRDDVKLLASIGTSNDDTLIDLLIDAVSDRVESLLARGAETVARTETISVFSGQKLFLLNAFPVTSIGDVLHSFDGTFSEDALVEGEGFRVDLNLGTLTLLSSFRGGELRVTHTSGMGTDTANFQVNFAGLSGAIALQVVNELQRRRSPGGSQTFQGGSMTFEGSISNLQILNEQIDAHRRTY